MANTALRFVASTLYNKVVSLGHTFVVGDVMKLSGGTFAKAQGNSAVNSEVVGIVSSEDTDYFYVTQQGYITGVPGSPFAAGTLYYLSPSTSGLLTATKPTTAGQYVVPCFIADTTSSGYFFANIGEVVTSSGSGFTWNEVIGTSQAMAVQNGYISNDAALVTLTLPATAVIGDVIRVAAKGAGGWLVAQNASQSIRLGNMATTAGVGGSLASTDLGDCIEILCTTTDTGFEVLSSVGNITIV